MAKEPVPGLVKTRLVETGLSAQMAADVAMAMLKCVLLRTRVLFGQAVLAISPDGRGDVLRSSLGMPDLEIVDQGAGDLGDRIDRVWLEVGADEPIVFFGIDSPLGSTRDGGFWALGALRHHEGLLRLIDWGTESVYDQTCQRIEESGLIRADLPVWDDVDVASDLEALRMRLHQEAQGGQTQESIANPLVQLARCLDELLDPM
jgi:glycosyltransferase A (GT-A) superfamily protein (DUF2064 family)